MVEAFATYADLQTLLNRTFTSDEQPWINALLASASTYLREDVIGQTVYPQTTSTYTDYPTAGRVDLPQFPVVSIGSVQRDAAEIDYVYRPGYILVDGDDPVDITYTWGYAIVPDRLKELACVLVSAALLTLEAKVGLTAGGLSSVALDDFKLAWADAGAQSGMTLPEIQKADLRRRYGRGGFTLVDTGR